MNVLESETK